MGKDEKGFDSRFEKLERMIADLKTVLTDRLKDMDSKLKKIEDSQRFLSSKHEDFKKIVDNLMKDNVDLRKQNEAISKRVDQGERNLCLARKEINDLEQYGRREMIEISGVPRSTGENIDSILSAIWRHLDVEIDHDSQIEEAHRISARDTANIIVKFSGRKVRNAVYSKRSALRGITAYDLGLSTKKVQNLYINESLTRQNKELFAAALEFKKQANYKYIWTRNGSIFIRETETSRPIKVHSKEVLATCSTNT